MLNMANSKSTSGHSPDTIRETTFDRSEKRLINTWISTYNGILSDHREAFWQDDIVDLHHKCMTDT